MKKRLIVVVMSILLTSSNVVFADNGVVNTKSSALSVRQKSSLSSSVIGYIAKNTKVTTLGKVAGFYKINYTGKLGYVSSNYIKIIAPVVVKPLVNKTQYGQVTASKLSIRTGPSVKYTEVGIFTAGTKVIMYDKVNNFYKLTYENKTGYVSAAYVKITAKPVVVVLTSASKTETIISNYNYSLDTITDIQYGLRMALTDSAGKWLLANKAQIKYYVDPINAQSAENKYQFLKLDYAGGISASDIDTVLSGKGVLNKKGKVVLDSCKSSNVNPAYLISHAFLESGYGDSDLANGIIVTQVKGAVVQPRVVYNLFGIGAVDAAPEKLGSEYAYSNNWFSVDQAIEGGANWISKYYINNATNKQNTLYKMRWNPYTTGMHQYATDIGWASKQTKSIKAIMDKFTNVDLYFDVPKYM